MTEPLFHNEDALLKRLSAGLTKRPQEVILLVGAGLSAPVASSPGVPGVEGVINLIRREFDDDPSEKTALETELSGAGLKRYQAAFTFLQGHRGQQTANEVVGRAVLAARKLDSQITPIDFTDQASAETTCRALEFDLSGWHLNPGTQAIGKLIARYPDRFGKTLLTTNFDPLVEVAIQQANGTLYRTVLHADGNIGQTEAAGCHVVHLHGYWYGADTLHTARQLRQSRPHLKDSLRSLLQNKLVVVSGYGGWDDVFTEALMDVVRNLTAYPEVLWTFHPSDPSSEHDLLTRLGPGIDRGRITPYRGIDAHHFFPELYEQWSRIEPPLIQSPAKPSNPVPVSSQWSSEVQTRSRQIIIEGNDEDRPPLVEICVGREDELQQLDQSKAKVVFLTGIGGQGKSTVAAKYFTQCQSDQLFAAYVWRDCKEESERFENQLASVIERLSGGRISGRDLADQDAVSIVNLLLNLIDDRELLFVFDNVDHYVDIETAKLTGVPNILILALLASASRSRAIFTCRPEVMYTDPFALSLRLEGLSLDSANKLFARRGASSTADQIQEAYELTKGHAFWLDLLAVQVAKHDLSLDLPTLVSQIGPGTELAHNLGSIWETLKDREQTVLQAMAETVKPDRLSEIADYLSGEINYHKVEKALKHLRALNLVVVKALPNASELFELHPLIRHFIRQNFPQERRNSFITRIIRVYKRFIGVHRGQLAYRPSLSVLQYWTQNAELDIAAHNFVDAFAILREVSVPFQGSAYPREFTRAARSLFSKVNWVSEHSKFRDFETVFRAYVLILCDLGELAEADNLLGQYEMTVPNRDVRYINYCDLRCYSKWVRSDFENAVTWGALGKKLKSSSNVDTKVDIEHHLALAERDAGRPEVALEVFLKGKELSYVTDPKVVEESRGGSYYGNIGRCLHLMGQIDPALVCYQKSALLLEKANTEHVINQGFIRAWIAELLVVRNQIALAYLFFRAAYLKWSHTTPLRAGIVQKLAQRFQPRVAVVAEIDDDSVESTCLDWILGEPVDERFK